MSERTAKLDELEAITKRRRATPAEAVKMFSEMPSLIAAARECEALKAENARLVAMFREFLDDDCDGWSSKTYRAYIVAAFEKRLAALSAPDAGKPPPG